MKNISRGGTQRKTLSFAEIKFQQPAEDAKERWIERAKYLSLGLAYVQKATEPPLGGRGQTAGEDGKTEGLRTGSHLR